MQACTVLLTGHEYNNVIILHVSKLTQCEYILVHVQYAWNVLLIQIIYNIIYK